MAANFIVGSSARLESTFRNTSGIKTDPDAVTLKVMAPDGITTTYTYSSGQITKDATGDYAKVVTFGTEGTWNYRWEGSGAVTAASEGRIEVTRSVFV